jgi:ferritin
MSLDMALLKPHELDKKVVNLLGERIADEYTAFYFYRSATNWCDDAGYKKAAEYFKAESANELTHAEGLEKYITDWNCTAPLPDISKPELEFKGLVDIIEKAYNMEYGLYEGYESASKSLLDMEDYCTFDLLQKYRTIQRESVAEYSDFLNKLALIDPTNKFELFYFENKHFKI